jgi:hypothetical protein
MDMLVKQTGDHVEFERDTWVQAFGLEMEMSGLALAQLAATCDPADEAYDYAGACHVAAVLRDELRAVFAASPAAMRLGPGDGLDALGLLAGQTVVLHETEPAVHRVSYHIPLHRWLAAFGGALLIKCGAAMDAMLGDPAAPDAEAFAKLLLEQPVLIQVLKSQARQGMWQRNGDMAYRQAWFYQSSNYTEYGPDNDLLLMQVCSAHAARALHAMNGMPYRNAHPTPTIYNYPAARCAGQCCLPGTSWGRWCATTGVRPGSTMRPTAPWGRAGAGCALTTSASGVRRWSRTCWSCC